MNVVKTLLFMLPVKASVGGSVYVPPTWYLRPAYSAAHAVACVERTGSARTHASATTRPATGLGQNSLFPEVR